MSILDLENPLPSSTSELPCPAALEFLAEIHEEEQSEQGIQNAALVYIFYGSQQLATTYLVASYTNSLLRSKTLYVNCKLLFCQSIQVLKPKWVTDIGNIEHAILQSQLKCNNIELCLVFFFANVLPCLYLDWCVAPC
jgi:hypothetical protein